MVPAKRKGGCLRTILVVVSVCFVLLCVIGAFASRSQSSNAIPRDLMSPTNPPTAIPPTTETQPAETATSIPTDVPNPTPPPEPTQIPAPTATVRPPTPIPPPTAVPTIPPPQQFVGSGKQVQDIVIPVLSRITLSHNGARNFAIFAYGPNDSKELLVNVIGPYQGVRYLAPGSYSLDIDADGSWSVAVTALGVDPSAAGAISGRGDDIRGMFAPQGSRATYRFTHDGKSNFAVFLLCDTGKDLIANEIGPFDGSAVVSFGGASICFWDISADGGWTATPQ